MRSGFVGLFVVSVCGDQVDHDVVSVLFNELLMVEIQLILLSESTV